MSQLTNSSVYVLPSRKSAFDFILSLLGTTLDELKPYNRKRWLSDKRQLAMYLIYTTCDKTYEEVGNTFARGHDTVMYACRQIKDRAFWDRSFKKQLSELLEKIQAYDLSD